MTSELLGYVPILVFGLAVVGLVLLAFNIVPQDRRLVIFRLGAYARSSGPGITLLVPLLERGVWVDMRPQIRTIQDVELVLSDRRRTKLDVTYMFRVVDAAASVRNVAQPAEALEQLVETTLRTLAAPLTRDEITPAFNSLEREIIERTRKAIKNWGIVLESVSLSKST